jgi:hypothetical protein
MPHYSFRISQGGQPETNSTADCRDDDAAKREAAGMFADMARDVSERLQSRPDWQIEVADDTGKPIFRIKITAETPR